MGYSTSKGAVLRNLVQLEQLLDSKTSLVFKTQNPHQLAYKLREAIFAAKHHEEFSHLAELKQMYQFKPKRGEVFALYEPTVPGEPIETIVVSKGNPPPPEKHTIPDAITLMDVLAVVMKHQDAQELLFPQASMSDDDKLKIFEWTEDKDWQFIDHEDAGLTLTKNEVPSEILWSPPNDEGK